MKTVIRHLRRAALMHSGDGPTDSQLLECFVLRRDETAFEALMRRHGPMVLGVCRRILRNAHDADDAFQATFLVLVRKACALRSRELLGNWLHGVAYRTAMKARAMNAKRRMKESQAGEMYLSSSAPDEKLLEQLDNELSRLPDKYRVPIVLCELEGRSRKEVARLLGIPEGTLSSRLAQAKKLLAKRLSRHELTISLGALAVGLSPTLRASTLKGALTAGTASAKVLALTEGVLKAMLLSKLKLTMCAAALMVLAGVGATGLTFRATAQEPKRPGSEAFFATTEERRPQVDELEALRLEMEALRKSLQATRERVKTLESEVSALKGQRQGSRGAAPGGGAGGRPGKNQGGPPGGLPVQGLDSGRVPVGPPPGVVPNGFPSQPGTAQGTMPPGTRGGGMMRKRTSDPVSDAEAALKKLRENPGDEQATEALEQALQRLKERENPNVPGERVPNPR